VTQYTQYVRHQGDQIVEDAKVLTDAVRAGDLDAAKAAYAPSRQAWERIEPIAGLVEEIDGKVDARVDDFESVDDPEFTGWHRIEHLLFEKGDVAAAVPFADQLDRDLTTLDQELGKLEIPPVTMAVGAAELIEEVSGGKITGEEDRYSGTDLWDFAANVEGSEKAYGFLAPALRKKDDDLAKRIETGFADVKASLEPYRDGDGWKPFSALTPDDTIRMKTELADLSEQLSQVAGTLGLE
jgi:iron uptake system component EfeO